MALTGYEQWKEELIIVDEEGREFCFFCGWGSEPPVAYVPAPANWRRCTPPWLHDRRDEVVEVMKRHRHTVEEGHYHDYGD